MQIKKALLYLFITTGVNAVAQVRDSVSLMEKNLITPDTIPFKHIFKKVNVFLDQNYTPLGTDFGPVNMYGGGKISLSAAFGYYAIYTNRVAVDMNLELSFKQFKAVEDRPLDTAYDHPQLKKGEYQCKQFFINIPLGLNYQWGKRGKHFRFGFSGHIVPKINLYSKLRGQEYLWDGTAREAPASYAKIMRPNVEARFGLIFEIPLGAEYKLRLLPLYRVNLFKDRKKVDLPSAISSGLGLELLF